MPAKPINSDQRHKNHRKSQYSLPTSARYQYQYAIDMTGPFYNGHYLVVLFDYFSRFPEIMDTTNITSSNIIAWLKVIWDGCLGQ